VHGAIAGAIEALHREQVDEHAALLAHHCEAAGKALAAARWAERAAERMDQAHPDEALRLWLKVRSLLHEVPQTSETIALGTRACTQVLNHGVTQRLSHEEAARTFEEAKALAALADDPAQHAFVIYRYGIFRGVVEGAIEEWIDLSIEALRLAEQAGDAAVEFYIKMGLGLGSLFAGRLQDAKAISSEALTHVDDPHFASHLTGRSPYAWLLTERASALQLMGQLRASEVDLERAITLSRSHGYLDSLAWGLLQRIHRATFLGEKGTASIDTEELLRLAEQTGAGTIGAYAHAAVSMAHSLSGNQTEAAEFLDAQGSILPEGFLLRGTEVLARVAQLFLTADRPEEARAGAERAISTCREMGARASECPAQITLAEALRRSQGKAAAGAIRDALARARELVEETEARVYQPRILEEEARLAQLEGDEAGFDSSLREAHRLYTEMGATGHAERLARELGL
jgi:tetratricopeptide (TPR) repeat protein